MTTQRGVGNFHLYNGQANHPPEKLLGQLKGAERDSFVEDIKPQLTQLKKYNYGKQIAAIEKLIFSPPTGPNSHHSHRPSTSSAAAAAYNSTRATGTAAAPPQGPAAMTPLDVTSAAPTPMLTTEDNSPESSGLPSANASTIDEGGESNGTTTGVVSKESGEGTPEVRIESV